MDCNKALQTRAEALEEADWQRLHRPEATQKRKRRDNEKQRIVRQRGYLKLALNFEDVAAFDYQPGKCKRSYRIVALRKNISKTKGEHTLFDDVRYFFYITTRSDLTPAQVVAAANQRCDQENVIEQLKNGVNALRVPLYDLVSNWAYMVIAALAWNVKSWLALMMHLKKHRRHYIRMDFRTFLNHIILYPCRVVKHARSTTIRIIGYQPSLNRLLGAWSTIQRTGFTWTRIKNRDHIQTHTQRLTRRSGQLRLHHNPTPTTHP